jgi:nitrous oxide reductase
MAQGNIYKFTLNKAEKKKVEVERKNKETGETETILQNKTVKTPFEFVVKKPTRRIIDEAEAQYAIELSKNIRRGIVTKDMMVKKYADTGGSLTEEEAKDMLRKLQKSNELANKIQLLSATNKKENKEEIEELEQELLVLRKELVDIEMSMQGVYEHTADARAERSMLLWYAIQLAKKIEEKEEKEFFDGIIYEDQLENLYEKDESGDEVEKEALSNFMLIVSYWFYNNNATENQIKEFIEKQKSG